MAFIIHSSSPSFKPSSVWKQFENTAAGLIQMQRWLTGMQVPLSGETIIVIENTGIGHLTATYLICCSNMFTMCSSGKQPACYAGVVPFGHQSGISIKGKHHVHKMANKELKRLLHMCALTSIKNHKEFKDYFERKKQEGKHAMSILNAIKNKLILRAFAVVKNERNYVDNCIKIA